LPDEAATAAPYLLLRNGIALYAAHTNLDAARGGVNDCLAALLGLSEVEPLAPDNLGRVGNIAPQTLEAFAAMAEAKLATTIRAAGDWRLPLTRVAVVGGSGADALQSARMAGAQALLTGEVKHHIALEAQTLGMGLIEAGHYETERPILDWLFARLQQGAHDVQYKVTSCETACLRGRNRP
jgi:dinuclear metal center YbgI/SA1388 family protein